MLAVLLDHFAEAYLRPNRLPLSLVYPFSQVASPAFMLVSGTLLGYFWVTRRERFSGVLLGYFGRGVFLLTVGRALIILSLVAFAGGLRRALHWGLITDAIGVSLIAGPLVVARVPRRARMVLALGLLGASWLAVMAWSPGSPGGKILRELLVGPRGPVATRWHTDVFPWIPWFAFFLLGTCFGERLAAAAAHGPRALAGLAARWGLVFLAVAVAVWTGGRILEQFTSLRPGLTLHRHLSIVRKLPPSLVYLALYGGVALGVLSLLLRCEGTAVLRRLRGWLEVLGRNSLFVFVFQYFLYFTLVWKLGMSYTPLWPALFLVSAALVLGAACLWDRTGWNRHLTLKMPQGLADLLARAAGLHDGGRSPAALPAGGPRPGSVA